jgi:hypothetical protein
MLIYYVYAYLRSDGTPYYIGKGKEARAFAKSTNHYPPEDKSRIVFIKENLDEYEALDLEKRMIRWYGRKDLGTGILRNLTDGGEGSSGSVRSEETKRKISEVRKNRKSSEETKRKISEANKGNKNRSGHKHSEETRRKISEATKKQSEDTRRKRSEAQKGRKLSEESRRKISESLKGNKNSSGYKHSEETRRKMSEAHKELR